MRKRRRYQWGYQEWYVRWSLWGIGYSIDDQRGWAVDDLTIYIGPIQIIFVSSYQMDGC